MAFINRIYKEQEIIGRIAALISQNSNYSFEQNFAYPNSDMRADLMLFLRNEPFAAIEIKIGLNKYATENAKKQLDLGRKIINLRYGIITDGISFKIIDWWRERSAYTIENAKDFEEQLYRWTLNDHTAPISKISINNYEALLTTTIQNVCPQFESSNHAFIYDETHHTIRLSVEDELKLFDLLIPPLDIAKVCRYTTLSTLFAMISNNTFRMYGAEGMNDNQDSKYLWNLLYTASEQQDRYRPQIIEPVFIVSCVNDNVEDLTMWRLYADDTKGVCVHFEIDKEIRNTSFYIRAVQYDDLLIQKLRTIVCYRDNKKYSSKYPTFIFNYWNLWGAFFKLPEYKIENEIRLIYIPTDNYKGITQNLVKPKEIKWIISSSNMIINQYAEFDKVLCKDSHFPLRLRTICLGPSCPEKEINKIQLERMLKDNDGCKDVDVVFSNIKSYRPTIK